jgi:hypothetical protein
LYPKWWLAFLRQKEKKRFFFSSRERWQELRLALVEREKNVFSFAKDSLTSVWRIGELVLEWSSRRHGLWGPYRMHFEMRWGTELAANTSPSIPKKVVLIKIVLSQ